MGTKPCKPVVPYEEVKDRLSTAEYEHLRRTYLNVSGGTSYEGSLSKDVVKAWLNTVYESFGDAVVNRLFEAIDSDASKTVNFKEYMQAAFVFSAGTRAEKNRLVFNMFDLGGANVIGRKDFKKMATAFIVGNRSTKWTYTVDTDDGKVEEEADLSLFKPITELMVDVGMLEYGDTESKLSFDDFQKYAEQDRDVSAFVDKMAKLVPVRHARE